MKAQVIVPDEADLDYIARVLAGQGLLEHGLEKPGLVSALEAGKARLAGANWHPGPVSVAACLSWEIIRCKDIPGPTRRPLGFAFLCIMLHVNGLYLDVTELDALVTSTGVSRGVVDLDRWIH